MKRRRGLRISEIVPAGLLEDTRQQKKKRTREEYKREAQDIRDANQKLIEFVKHNPPPIPKKGKRPKREAAQIPPELMAFVEPKNASGR